MGGSGFVEGNLFDIYNRPQGPPRSFQPEQVDILSEQLDDHGRIIHRIERIVSTGQVRMFLPTFFFCVEEVGSGF